MKKYIFILILLSAFFTACGGSKKVVKKKTVVVEDTETQEERLKKDAPINVKKGIEACKSKNHKEAQKYFELALKGEPNNYIALSKLAKINFHHGDLEKAENFYRKAYNVNDKDRNLALAYGNLLIKLERWPDAKTFFQTAFAKDSTFAEAAISLLAIYKRDILKEKDADKRKKLLSKAEKIAQKALKEIPGDAALYNNLGQLYYIMDKKPLAFYVLSIAEKSDEKSPIVLNTIGWYHESEGNIPFAKYYYKKALKNDPNYLPALKNMVRFYIESLDYSSSKKTFELIYKLEPTNMKALYGLAISELGLFNFDKAIELFKTLLEKEKDTKYALMIAEVYHKQLVRAPKYAENKAKKKEFLTKAKEWYQKYLDDHKSLRADDPVVMAHKGIDGEIKWLDSADEEMKEPEEKKEATEEQKKKLEELKNRMKEQQKLTDEDRARIEELKAKKTLTEEEKAELKDLEERAKAEENTEVKKEENTEVKKEEAVKLEVKKADSKVKATIKKADTK